MKRISPSELVAGMKLARSLTDQMGRMLLEKGEVLTDAFVQKLQSWPIDVIYIEETEEEGATPVSNDEIENKIAKIVESVENTFSGIKDKNMQAIKKSAIEFLTSRLRERLE